MICRGCRILGIVWYLFGSAQRFELDRVTQYT